MNIVVVVVVCLFRGFSLGWTTTTLRQGRGLVFSLRIEPWALGGGGGPWWGSLPGVVHRCASVDVGGSGVGSVHHQQLRLEDLPRLGRHVERSGAFFLRQTGRQAALGPPPTHPGGSKQLLPDVTLGEASPLTGWKKLAWAPRDSSRRHVSRLPVLTLEWSCYRTEAEEERRG